jgi:hypothetical protein
MLCHCIFLRFHYFIILPCFQRAFLFSHATVSLRHYFIIQIIYYWLFSPPIIATTYAILHYFIISPLFSAIFAFHFRHFRHIYFISIFLSHDYCTHYYYLMIDYYILLLFFAPFIDIDVLFSYSLLIFSLTLRHYI